MSDKLVESLNCRILTLLGGYRDDMPADVVKAFQEVAVNAEALEQRVKVLSGLLEEARDIYVDECFGRGDNEFKARIDAALSA